MQLIPNNLIGFFDDPLKTLNSVFDDTSLLLLISCVLGLLFIASFIGRMLERQTDDRVNIAVVRAFNHRIRAWWLMIAILVVGFVTGKTCTVVLFGLISFWALREFITMTPTRRSDHRALFWSFFIITPLQFVMVGMKEYGLFSTIIPVYASLLIPARIAVSNDQKQFLERSAKIQLALLICVYALSFAPATLYLDLPNSDNESARPEGLLFFFVLITQLNDIFQYGWGKLLGDRRVIAPNINARRSWEGFIGGAATTTLVGALLHSVTPFEYWQAALLSLVVAIMGFFGGMVMSAIKRDRGVSDFGTLVQGHAGVLDRIDSMCFAAPIFYHVAKAILEHSDKVTG